MMKKNTILLLVIAALLPAAASAQRVDSVPKVRKNSSPRGLFRAGSNTARSFPQSFAGRWKGTLTWTVAGKPPQTFTMRLHILPADSGAYTWQIIYGDKGADNRPYLLKPVDTARGHWVVDEGNGIVLDSYVHGNALQGAFTVQGNTIVDNYRLENGRMFVEFFSIKLDERKTSGRGTDESPKVDSYRTSSYQAGYLTRERPQR